MSRQFNANIPGQALLFFRYKQCRNMKITLRRKFKEPAYSVVNLSVNGKIFCNTIADIVPKHVAGVSSGIRVILIPVTLIRLTDSLAPEGGDSLRDVLLYVQEIKVQFLNMVVPFRKQLPDARNIVGIVVQSVHD